MTTWKSIVRRALLGVDHQADRISRGIQSAVIGSLQLSDVRAGIERRAREFNTDDADIKSGLNQREQTVLSQFVRPSDRILIVGCGTGRDMLALLTMGRQVTGVDPSASALAIAARMLDGQARTICGYFEDLELDGEFDVIYFSNFCYALIPESKRRIESLRKAVSVLAPGGRIILSCAITSRPLRSRFLPIARAVGKLTGADWRMEHGDRFTPLEPWQGLFDYRHIFGPGEIEVEATAASLQVAFAGRRRLMTVLTAQDEH